MPKNIVICCDGTNNQMTGHETNVLRLYRALVRDSSQIVFYHPGVGTLADPMSLSRLRKFLQRSLDAAIGRSLCEIFSDVYRCLAVSYQTGDSVYLFGFSRGAYAARAVAGAIHMLGLIRPELGYLVPYVWSIYANDGGAYDVRTRFGGAARFRKLFCVPEGPTIRLLGLWDTVSSFGWFWNFQSLPYTANNPSVQIVLHALSIDERRAAFQANLFRDAAGATAASEAVKQVWFPGVHADVGGGYPDDEGQLSKIAFAWMIEEIRAGGELRIQQDTVERILGLTSTSSSTPDPLGRAHASLRGWWHVMEWLPRRQLQKLSADTAAEIANDKLSPGPRRKSRARAAWVKRWVLPHLYRRRRIPPRAWIHPSVAARRAGRKYNPVLPSDAVDVVFVAGKGYMPATADVPPGGCPVLGSEGSQSCGVQSP